MGIGNYWRNSHEFLLTAVRGPNRSFRDHGLQSYKVLGEGGAGDSFLDTSMPSFRVIERGQHSAKPYEVRRMVERASPGPWLELFGRKAIPGWVVFGNQVDTTVGLFDKEVDER
jgi:N6-adenosine-specific RNA methylase IME4